MRRIKKYLKDTRNAVTINETINVIYNETTILSAKKFTLS